VGYIVFLKLKNQFLGGEPPNPIMPHPQQHHFISNIIWNYGLHSEWKETDQHPFQLTVSPSEPMISIELWEKLHESSPDNNDHILAETKINLYQLLSQSGGDLVETTPMAIHQSNPYSSPNSSPHSTVSQPNQDDTINLLNFGDINSSTATSLPKATMSENPESQSANLQTQVIHRWFNLNKIQENPDHPKKPFQHHTSEEKTHLFDNLDDQEEEGEILCEIHLWYKVLPPQPHLSVPNYPVTHPVPDNVLDGDDSFFMEVINII